MKIVEPISSALLITGCVYVAGISQNSAFMREFGVNPEFSQPSVDKILYDGGLITFEIFYGHLKLSAVILLFVSAMLVAAWLAYRLFFNITLFSGVVGRMRNVTAVLSYVPLGFLLLIYIMYLCFSSYQRSQEVGVKLSETFMESCHWVVLKDKDETTKACAFRKDKDSIWYYKVNGGRVDVNSKLLTELGQVTYLEPQSNQVVSNSVNEK